MLLAPLVDYHQLLSRPLIVLVVSVAGALLHVAQLYYAVVGRCGDVRQTMCSGVLTALMLAAYYLCEEYV